MERVKTVRIIVPAQVSRTRRFWNAFGYWKTLFISCKKQCTVSLIVEREFKDGEKGGRDKPEYLNQTSGYLRWCRGENSTRDRLSVEFRRTRKKSTRLETGTVQIHALSMINNERKNRELVACSVEE